MIRNLVLFLVLGICMEAFAQHPVLYYSVKNVSEISTSNAVNNIKSSQDIQTIGETNNESNTVRKDEFLIPFIITQVGRHTSYLSVVRLNESDKNKLVTPYSLLRISINKLNNNLEYQFHLYEKNGRSDSLIKFSSFFIDPDNQEYSNIISTEVQKLFVDHGGTNKSPIAKIRIDRNLVSGKDTIYRSNQDTIFLDATSSEDEETPKKYLGYRWRAERKGDDNAFLSDFNFENSQQKLVINEQGAYTFYLSVSDGVSTSAEDSVIVFIIKKPFLDLHQSFYIRISQRNLFSKKERKIYGLKENIDFDVTEFDPESNLIFNYLSSRNKSKKYFLEYHKRRIFEFHSGIMGNISMIEELPGNPRPGSEALQTGGFLSSDTSVYITNRIDSTLDVKIVSSRFGKESSLEFMLSNKIAPGNHKYVIYTNYKGVTSNYDTVTISYREKSLFSFYEGFHRFAIIRGKDYFNGTSMDIFKFGVRGYVTQRMFFDLNTLLMARSKKIFGRSNTVNTFMGSVNYDLLPVKTSGLNKVENPIYLSGFLSYYQFVVADSSTLDFFPQVGCGVKPRIQLFANSPKIGVLHLEFELGFYPELLVNKTYNSWTLGINLLYGFWNY